MTPERWQRVRALFEETFERQAEEREALLAAASDDPEIVAEVRRMLAGHDEGSSRLDRGPTGIAALDPLAFQTFFPGEKAAGRFVIRKLIGRGGMGEVYEAEDAELGGVVALKALQPGLAVNEEALERFKREIQLSRRVTHPNVCRVFDLFIHKTGNERPVLFLTMELIEGKTLSQTLLANGPYTASGAMPVVRQIAGALAAAHAAHVVHRDLKASNILIDGATGRVAITDFGLARSIEEAAGSSLDGSRIGIGTPAYMTPEQMEGGEVTPATDVYAFGVVLHEMVTGQLPFQGGTAMALAVQKLKEKPRPASQTAKDLPPQWDEVIERCLEYKASDRFGSVTDVLRALGGEIPVRAPARKSWNRPVTAVCAAILTFVGMEALRRPSAPANESAARYLAAAEEALSQRSFLRARNLAEESLRADPSYYRTHARLAQAYMELDQLDRGRDHIIRAATLLPSWIGITQWEKAEFDGVQQSVLKDRKAAAARFREAMRSAPAARRSALQLQLASALEEAGETTQALSEYEALTRARPDFSGALLRYGRLLALSKGLDAGLAKLTEAERRFEVERNGDMVLEARLEAALAMRDRKRLPDSFAALEAVEKEAGARNAVAVQVRARSAMALVRGTEGDAVSAYTLIRETSELARRSNLDILALLGKRDLAITFLAQSNWKEAEQVARATIAEAGEQKAWLVQNSAKVSLASALIRQFRIDEAMPIAREAIRFYTDRRFGSILFRANGLLVNAAVDTMPVEQVLPLAEAYVRSARASAPRADLARALSLLGHVLIMKGAYPAVTELQREMFDLYMADGQRAMAAIVSCNEADLHARMGQHSQALALLTRSSELGKTLSEIPTALAERCRDNLARLQMMTGDVVGLEKILPRIESPRVLRAEMLIALARSGQAELEARAVFEQTKSGNEKALAIAALSSALLMQGRQSEAAEQLKLIADLRLVRRQQETVAVESLLLAEALFRSQEDASRAVSTARSEFERMFVGWSSAARRGFLNRVDLRRKAPRVLERIIQ